MTIDVRDLSGSLDVVSFWKVNSTLSLHEFAMKHIAKKTLSNFHDGFYDVSDH